MLASAWILEELIWPFTKYKDAYKSPSRMLRGFQEAVDTAEKCDENSSLADDEVCYADFSVAITLII